MRAQERTAVAGHSGDTAATQLLRYLSEIDAADVGEGLAFWQSRSATYSAIMPLAEDLLVAPASQAYVERVFSLCGLLTAGRRNRTSKALEMRAFLKLNKHIQ